MCDPLRIKVDSDHDDKKCDTAPEDEVGSDDDGKFQPLIHVGTHYVTCCHDASMVPRRENVQ